MSEPRHGVISYDDQDEWLIEDGVEETARIVARDVPRWFGRLVVAALVRTPETLDALSPLWQELDESDGLAAVLHAKAVGCDYRPVDDEGREFTGNHTHSECKTDHRGDAAAVLRSWPFAAAYSAASPAPDPGAGLREVLLGLRGVIGENCWCWQVQADRTQHEDTCLAAQAALVSERTP